MRSLLLAFILLSLHASAQTPANPSYEIKGRITDSVSAKSLDFVTVGLKTSKNIAVKSVLTNGDGEFSFKSVQPGEYNIAVVSVGYKPKTISVNLTKDEDLGAIALTASNTTLNEVVFTVDKPLIKQDIDKISYDLQADPESKSNNVLEMMRKVPLLSLDAEDNIQLKGNTNYKILINGKPSGMVDKNPKDVLRSMPASTIQSIEVITNPPAKYDSEGLAGIINIITNRKIDNGYNGSLNFNQRFPVGGPGGGGSFTFKQGKFGASANFGTGVYSAPATDNLSTRTTTGANPTDLRQVTSRESDNRYGYLSTELSYEIDSLNLLSAQFGVGGGSFNSDAFSNSVLNNPSGLLQGYDLNSEFGAKYSDKSASLNYQLGFKSNKNRLLTFSYRFSTFGEDADTYLRTSNRFNYNIPDYRQTNDGRSPEQTVQLDYIHPLKKLTIEGGLKGIIRDNKSDFLYGSLNSVTGNYDIDPSRTNIFNNIQKVYSLYNSYQYSMKDWSVKAGLRLEETIVDADFVSSAALVNQDYFNLIPSISVSRKFKNMITLTGGYTQRIQRPNIWNLNPFVNRSNPNFESTGNPELRPVLQNNFQLNFSRFKKGSVNVGLSYSYSNNTIQSITTFDAATNITRSRYENIGRDKVVGSNLNISYPITKKWNFNLNSNLSYVFLEGMVNGQLLENEGMRGNFNGSSGYRFEKGLRLNANVFYSTPYVSLQGRNRANIFYGMSVNKDVIKDKLSFSASTNNPLKKFRTFYNNTSGENFDQFNSYTNFFRAFGVGLNYRFGKLKDSIKKNKRGINNDDVSSGGGSAGSQ